MVDVGCCMMLLCRRQLGWRSAHGWKTFRRTEVGGKMARIASQSSKFHQLCIWAPAKTSDILEQLRQDIDTWYYHDTLRNDRGDTENDDFWYTCLTDFSAHIKSSGTMRDTRKAMTISATSFHGCSRFSPLLIYSYTHIYVMNSLIHKILYVIFNCLCLCKAHMLLGPLVCNPWVVCQNL